MNKKVLISSVIVLALAILGAASYYIFSQVGADVTTPSITKGIAVKVTNRLGKAYTKNMQVRPTVYVAGKYKKKDSNEIKWFYKEVTLPVKNVNNGGVSGKSHTAGKVEITDKEISKLKSNFAPTITVGQ